MLSVGFCYIKQNKTMFAILNEDKYYKVVLIDKTIRK